MSKRSAESAMACLDALELQQDAEGVKPVLVEDYMTKEVRTVHSKSLTMFAVRLMSQYGIRHMVVSDDTDPVRGVFSQRDLLKHLARRFNEGDNPGRTEVRQFMTSPVDTITAQETIGTAATRMTNGNIGCLPVVDANGTLVGILTRSDIMRYVEEQHKS